MHMQNSVPKPERSWVSILLAISWFLIGSIQTVPASELLEVGFRDFTYPAGTAGNSRPTSEKPESKLWFNDGFWWGYMWSPTGNAYHIYQLDEVAQDWVDTGTAADSRSDTRGDALWDEANQKLYIVSHVFASPYQRVEHPSDR